MPPDLSQNSKIEHKEDFYSVGYKSDETFQGFLKKVFDSLESTRCVFTATWSAHDYYRGLYTDGAFIVMGSDAFIYTGNYDGTSLSLRLYPRIISGLNNIEFLSSISSGWVLRQQGIDTNGKEINIGFDATGGIYCYYDGELV